MSIEYKSSLLDPLNENVFKPLGDVKSGDKVRVWLNDDVQKLSLKVEKAIVDKSWGRAALNKASGWGAGKVTGYGTLRETNFVIQSALQAATEEVEKIQQEITTAMSKIWDSVNANRCFQSSNFVLYELECGLWGAKTGIANLLHTYLQEQHDHSRDGIRDLENNVNALNMLLAKVQALRSLDSLNQFNEES